ncbi:MAG: hypothetical protein IT384_21030 [Deltaproteobacteria bacterium]|nr:hypothetical protein [Deltaproteobacteria bacterium]
MFERMRADGRRSWIRDGLLWVLGPVALAGVLAGGGAIVRDTPPAIAALSASIARPVALAAQAAQAASRRDELERYTAVAVRCSVLCARAYLESASDVADLDR